MTDNNNNDIAINGHGNDPQQEEPEQQQEPVECRPQDVWFGQGRGAIREHPGNVHKRNLIAHHLKRYIAASSQEKQDLCQEIYDMISEVDGLFLCKKGDDYFQVTKEEALEKIMSSFFNLHQREKRKDQPKQVAVDPLIDQLRAQLAEAEAAKNRALEEATQLRTQLEESRAQTSDAVSEADRLRQELVELSDMISVDGVSASIFQEVANAVGGDDLSAEFKSMSMEQRRKTARTANPSGSAKDSSVLPGMDAGTIVTGLTDWKRSFVDLAQNLQEMGIDEKLKFKNGSYLGSVLRDKPHGLGLMRLRDRVMVANWNNGVATGQACVLYRNGGTYYGRLERNERHGEGLFIGSVKDTKKGSFKYVGSFQNDYRHGKGRFKFTEGHKLNGHEYEGNFVKGVFEGMGNHWLPNGTMESGRFVNWKLQKEASQPENTDS